MYSIIISCSITQSIKFAYSVLGHVGCRYFMSHSLASISCRTTKAMTLVLATYPNKELCNDNIS